MATPQTTVNLDSVSSLCSSRHPSNVLTGIWTRLLQEHFSNADNLEFGGQNETTTQLKNLVWVDGGKNDIIQIKPVWEYDTKDPSRRPGLYVKRNKTTFERVGINDGFSTGMPRNAAGLVVEPKGEFHNVTMVGSHTVFCVGRTGAETELLSQEVTNHIAQFSPSLRSALKLHRLMISEVGEVGLLDEFVEHFVVPVVIGYALPYSWRLIQVQPFLKKVGLSLET
jgi:hypothetical protein